MLRYGHISTWDTSQVTNMDGLFTHAFSFNENINEWDVSHVTSMRGMFAYAVKFNQPLDRWDVRQVRDMRYMFRGVSVFNQSLDCWEERVSYGTLLKDMFRDVPAVSIRWATQNRPDVLDKKEASTVDFVIRSLLEHVIWMQVKRSDTLEVVRERQFYLTGIPNCEFIFRGKSLSRSIPLSQYTFIGNGDTVNIVFRISEPNQPV
jgi:hypothetical protein